MFNCIISSKERFAMQVEGNRLQNKYDSRDATTFISIDVQDWACAGLLSDKTLCWKKLKHFKIRVPAICYKCTETAISPTIWVGYIEIFLLSSLLMAYPSHVIRFFVILSSIKRYLIVHNRKHSYYIISTKLTHPSQHTANTGAQR